jgi:hypothetical protein
MGTIVRFVMLTKMTTRTTKSTAIMKKASRLLPRSFGLAVAIVIVIAAIYVLLLVALSTVAAATSDQNEHSIDDKYVHSICDPTGLGSGDPCEIVTH